MNSKELAHRSSADSEKRASCHSAVFELSSRKDAIIANESDDLSETRVSSRSESGRLNLTGRKSFWLEVGLVEISGSRVGEFQNL